MLKLDLPLLLVPVFKPKPWGRVELAPPFAERRHEEGAEKLRRPRRAGRPPAKDRERIGEVWLTADSARFRTGPVAGMTLGEVSEHYGAALHGAGWKGARFPILAKYLYTDDWLSVQVHPDDEYAARHERGSPGKCEMWYFLESRQEAVCWLGAKPGTSKKALRDALAHNRIGEALQRFRPEAEEAVWVPPGTIHALGPGLSLFEVEQNSDVTYRLDDFGRPGPDGKPRRLHLDDGLAVVRPELAIHRDLPRLIVPESYGWRRYVLACPFFALEELRVEKPGSFTGSPERVEAFSVVSGQGRIETAAGWLGYGTGETWLIPPGLERYRLVPSERTRLLKFYVPDLTRDFEQPLVQRGVKPEQISRIIFP